MITTRDMALLYQHGYDVQSFESLNICAKINIVREIIFDYGGDENNEPHHPLLSISKRVLDEVVEMLAGVNPTDRLLAPTGQAESKIRRESCTKPKPLPFSIDKRVGPKCG